MRNLLPNFPPDVLLPLDPATLQMELAGYASAQEFTVKTVERFEENPNSALQVLVETTKLMELADMKAGVTAFSAHSRCFYSGGIIGLRMIEAEKGADFTEDLFTSFDAFPLPDFSHVTDGDEQIRVIAEAITQIGDYGFSLAEPYHDLIDAMGKEISGPERTGQLFVRRGFGMTAFMAGSLAVSRLTFKEQLVALELQLDVEGSATHDWDDGWDELNDSTA